MTDLNNLLSPFFLNDKEIRKVIELLFFSYRDFTSGPDKILEKLNFGRAHHRVIYFVGKKNNITTNAAIEPIHAPREYDAINAHISEIVTTKVITTSVL